MRLHRLRWMLRIEVRQTTSDLLSTSQLTAWIIAASTQIRRSCGLPDPVRLRAGSKERIFGKEEG